MKSSKIGEFSKMDLKQLLEQLKEKRKQLEKLRFDLDLQKLKDIRQIRATRVEIAQILTVLNSKLREEEVQNETA